jgi:octaheme c-type cytochrome (tetrathionate reductase family)
MKNTTYVWIIGLLAVLIIIATPIIILWPTVNASANPLKDNPAANLPVRAAHTDHSSLMVGPYETGSDVTRACLSCHPDSAGQVMQTSHWTWESEPVMRDGEMVTIGKKNQINNYCIGTQGNYGCMSCHAGYGWTSASFDFTIEENVDCLVCHEQSGGYVKTKGGLPAEGVDLIAAAQSVAYPSRSNCGSCHFNGGGGNGVKHADLNQHLINPFSEADVHMGGQNFLCTDCHQSTDHVINGKSMSNNLVMTNEIACTDCHIEAAHEDERLNKHVSAVACQTCHIPSGSKDDPTKIEWDWSTAGQDIPENAHSYLKIKGSFVYAEEYKPEYYWYSGLENRYLLGDVIDPTQPTPMNPPAGSIQDLQAKIFPFKVHRTLQPYDSVFNILLQPRTSGEGGYWTTFDWPSALELGSQDTGLPFSGQFGFAPTEMWMPITHLVVPVEYALQCADCHTGDGEGRLNWAALGYPGDPLEWGGRTTQP